MKTVILPDKRRLTYELTRKSVKNINFRPKEDGIVYVSASPRVSIKYIEQALAEKADFFFDKEFYSFSSSVSDDYIPMNKDVTRITDIIFTYHIYEDDKKFYIRSLSQIDFKMNVPQSLLNVTLPMKMKEWFKSMIAYMQKDYADEHK